MLGIEEGPMILTGDDAAKFYEDYKQSYGEPVFLNEKEKG